MAQGDGRTMSNRSRLPSGVRRALRGIMNGLAISNGNVSVGRDFNAGRGAIISAPHGLNIGDNVSVGPRTVIQVDGSIGSHVMIGMNVYIVGREDHAIDEVGIPMLASTWVGDREPGARDSVEIGTDVWIGACSVILSGVTIGDGAVIGAGSVVTSDVESFSVNVGVPARKVGERFESDTQRSAHLQAVHGLSS
ncbi:acyltransferase [Rhodococcus sp. NPDC057135]|uniref:acyltransferase n=1 Tax=Rhodococcus sp. NPDC057135 TaxID=3346028 RepID=UPI00363CA5EF